MVSRIPFDSTSKVNSKAHNDSHEITDMTITTRRLIIVMPLFGIVMTIITSCILKDHDAEGQSDERDDTMMMCTIILGRIIIMNYPY